MRLFAEIGRDRPRSAEVEESGHGRWWCARLTVDEKMGGGSFTAPATLPGYLPTVLVHCASSTSILTRGSSTAAKTMSMSGSECLRERSENGPRKARERSPRGAG